MSLLDRLHDLQARARRLVWIGGLSGAGSAFLIGLLACALFDWWWHLDSRWLRTALLAVVIWFVGRIVLRRLWQPLRQPMGLVEWSGRLEQRFPKLRGRLSSAIEFAEHGVSPKLGSPELQRRLIEATAADAAQVEFTEVLNRREATRAAWRFAAVVVFIAILALSNRTVAGTAVSRWLWPLGDRPWPREVELRFARGDSSIVERERTAPLKSLQGQPLDLFVVNVRGELPQPVTLEFRRSGHPVESAELRQTSLRDAADRARNAAAVKVPFESGVVEMRAIGGDDRDMPWQTLEFIPLVRLKTFRVKVIPPGYTGEPESTWTDGVTQLKATVGSKVLIEGTASREVREAHWDEDFAALPIANKRQLRTERMVTTAETRTWRLALTDANGFENPAGLSLSVIGMADPPPIVTLDDPANDQSVAPNAVVRLVAAAKDDRGLREAFGNAAVITPRDEPNDSEPRLDNSASIARPAHHGEHEGDMGDVKAKSIAGFRWPEADDAAAPPLPLPKQLTLRQEWSLAELSLRVGDRVRLQVIARDACDVGEPRVGRSAIRTLTVVSAETKAAEIANRLDLLLQDLLAVAERQTATQSDTNDLRVQFDNAGELRPQDRDVLKRVDLDQRLIDSRLTGRDDGLAARARSLLADIETNRLPESPVQRRLAEVAKSLQELGRETLPPLETALRDIVKSLVEDTSRNLDQSGKDRVVEQFTAVRTRQATVLEALNGLVRDLTEWRDRRELARELADLANSQREVTRDTSEFAPQSLGKSVTELSNQQRADLAKLADRQARQAEQIQQLRQRLAARANQESADPTDSQNSDTTSAQAGRDTLAELDQRGVAARSRDAARDVAANKLGQAAADQQQAANDLQALADKLQAGTESPTATADQFADSVRGLIARQQQVIDETERLAHEQSQVGKWTRPLSKAALQLAEAEQSLADATQELQKLVAPATAQPPDATPPRDPASVVLELAARDLSIAAAKLRERQLDDETKSRERDALRRLQSLADAIAQQTATAESSDADDRSSREPNSDDQPSPPDGPVPPVAQLKLLKQLQSEVRDNTEQTDSDKPQSDSEVERRQAQIKQLADDQDMVAGATRQLLDRIPTAPPESPEADKLPDETQPRDQALSAMRRAAEALSRSETGQPTQADQRQAVSQLDALLKIWQQRADRQTQLARSGQRAPMPKDTGDPDAANSSPDGQPGSARGRDNPNAQKSSDRDDTGPDREALAQRDRQLREAIWGHLPPALREKMLNLPHDKLMPKYADHIRRYYEALAEER